MLIAVAALIVILFPLLLIFLKNASYENNFAMQERKIKATRSMANSVMTDFMRQFSQSPVETGNTLARIGITPATDPLIRLGESFTKSGFTETKITTSTETNSLYFEASGFLRRADDPAFLNIKQMSGVVRIENPILRYGDSRNPRFGVPTWNVPWVIPDSIHLPLGLNIQAGVKYIFKDDVIINGNLTCSSVASGVSTEFKKFLYISGTYSGNCSFDPSYPPIPMAPVTKFIPLDLSYYITHNTILTNVDEWWVFRVDGTNGKMDRFNAGLGPTKGGLIETLTIPDTGAIFVSSGAVVSLEGQVKGRVTVVAASFSPRPSPSHAVYIQNDLSYADGSNTAKSDYSFAVLTDGRIVTKKNPPGAMITNGLFLSTFGPGSNFIYTGANAPTSHTNFGTMASIFWEGPAAGYTANYFKDPNLARFPPPGVPAQAFLVNWHVE